MRASLTPQTVAAVLLLVGSLAVPASAQELMPSGLAGWSAFAPRPQSAPRVSSSIGTSGVVLGIEGATAPGVYGGWRTRITGLQGGAYYRFGARAVPLNIERLRESVTVVLRWRGSFGDEVAPDYVWDFRQQGDGSLQADRVIKAPAGATAVDVELVLQWAANGQVTFDSLTFKPATAPPARKVRVAALYYRPSGTASGYASVQQASNHAAQVASTYRPDIIVLGELLNVIGAPGTMESKAEPIPGRSTDALAAVAAAYRVNIVAGLLESSGNLLYNSAVLIDRNGAIAGKYQKVQLPLQDASAGISPGTSVPVFDADFGRIALLICQDAAFPEPAREAALRGAEILIVPIWGGKTSLVRARAVENGIYLAASGYDYASEVVNPLGTVLATVKIGAGPKAAIADLDLNQRFREAWLGDWRDIASKERRVDPYRYRVP
jgi:predicted amidohydrolase